MQRKQTQLQVLLDYPGQCKKYTGFRALLPLPSLSILQPSHPTPSSLFEGTVKPCTCCQLTRARAGRRTWWPRRLDCRVLSRPPVCTGSSPSSRMKTSPCTSPTPSCATWAALSGRMGRTSGRRPWWMWWMTAWRTSTSNTSPSSTPTTRKARRNMWRSYRGIWSLLRSCCPRTKEARPSPWATRSPLLTTKCWTCYWITRSWPLAAWLLPPGLCGSPQRLAQAQGPPGLPRACEPAHQWQRETMRACGTLSKRQGLPANQPFPRTNKIPLRDRNK